jgi:hypothetical protein
MQPDPVAKAVGGGVMTPGLRKNRPKWADFLPKHRKIASKSIRAAGLGENSALRRDYFRGLLRKENGTNWANLLIFSKLKACPTHTPSAFARGASRVP